MWIANSVLLHVLFLPEQPTEGLLLNFSMWMPTKESSQHIHALDVLNFQPWLHPESSAYGLQREIYNLNLASRRFSAAWHSAVFKLFLVNLWSVQKPRWSYSFATVLCHYDWHAGVLSWSASQSRVSQPSSQHFGNVIQSLCHNMAWKSHSIHNSLRFVNWRQKVGATLTFSSNEHPCIGDLSKSTLGWKKRYIFANWRYLSKCFWASISWTGLLSWQTFGGNCQFKASDRWRGMWLILRPSQDVYIFHLPPEHICPCWITDHMLVRCHFIYVCCSLCTWPEQIDFVLLIAFFFPNSYQFALFASSDDFAQ